MAVLEKKWWESKTVWFNLIGGLIVLLQYIGTINGINPEITGSALVVGNFLLRFLTDEKVERSLT